MLLHGAVPAFPEVVGPHDPRRIDQVVRGPVVVAIRGPGIEVVVDGDRIVDPQVPRRILHVGDDVLEGELRRGHADHDETVLLVVVVPTLHVGQRPLAVDARVRPEVHQHDLAAQALQAEGLVARCVEPCRDPGEVRRVPQVGQVGLVRHERCRLLRGARRRRRGGGSRREVPTLRIALVGRGTGRLLPLEPGVGGGELVLVLAAELAQLVTGRAGGLDVVLERRRVPRHVSLEAAEPIERDGQGGDPEHHPRHLAHDGQVAAQRRPARGGALGDDRQNQEGQRDAEGVEQRHEEGAAADAVMGGGDGDRRQDRAGTRHEDGPQAQAEDEAPAFGGVAGGTEPGKGPLERLADLGDQEADRDRPQHGHAEPEQEVLGQVQETQHRAREEHREAETQHQAGDDHEWPSTAAARRPTRQDDRDHRHDARGEAGDQAAQEGDDEQLTHGSSLAVAAGGTPALLRDASALAKLAGGVERDSSPPGRDGRRWAQQTVLR